MIKQTKNKVSESIKLTREDIQLNKTKKGNKFDNADVVAIHEWFNKKEGFEIFSALRAIALLCTIVDGFDNLFFSIAKEIPKKISMKESTIDEIYDTLKDTDKNIFSPSDYIKTMQISLNNSEYTKNFMADSELVLDNLGEINKKFKILTNEEYEKLTDFENTENNTEDSFSELQDFAKSILLKRSFLND